MTLPAGLYTISEAAQYLHVCPKTLWNLLSLHRGLFAPARYQRFGPKRTRHRMLTLTEIEALLRMLVKEKASSL